MPLGYSEDAETGTVILTVNGPLCGADYAAVMAPMAAFIQRCGTIKVIEVIESFAGFEETVSSPDDPSARALLDRITHVALVSDIGWFCPILSDSPISRTRRMRNFRLSEVEAARQWLADPD